MVKVLFELDEHINTLTGELKNQFGLNLQKTVSSTFDCVDILLSDPAYPFGKDWMPSMAFTIFFSKEKVVLKSIRLPKELQNKGIGSHCFAWLINLCKYYDIGVIEGKVVGDSRGFWDKKGCGKAEYIVKKS